MCYLSRLKKKKGQGVNHLDIQKKNGLESKGQVQKKKKKKSVN